LKGSALPHIVGGTSCLWLISVTASLLITFKQFSKPALVLGDKLFSSTRQTEDAIHALSLCPQFLTEGTCHTYPCGSSDTQGSLHLKLEMPVEGDIFQVCH